MSGAKEGVHAPFFVCQNWALLSSGRRDDALLAAAVSAFEQAWYADALLMVESVCRNHPEKAIPALLRARIVEKSCPSFAGKAWFQAFCCDPENPLFQDALLQAWLQAGQHATVRQLALHFMPARCRTGDSAALLKILNAVGVSRAGACWLEQGQISVCVFGDSALPLALRFSCGPHSFVQRVRADGVRVDIPLPPACAGEAVWTLCFDEDGQGLAGSPLAFAPALPPLSAQNTYDKQETASAAVTILIPVYRGLQQVQQCLHSVLQSLAYNRTPVRVLVLDDAGPEPALAAWLQELQQAGQIELMRHPQNMGYLESVNLGLSFLRSRRAQDDVLLLNADTIVHGDWVDRMRAGLYAAPDIASVTPWSNNGEISSFPQIGKSAPCPNPEQLAALDNAAAQLTQAAQPVPACCGFCMLIRGSALAQTGGLDGSFLLRGYGEEVDWCLRATRHGWRHMLLPQVFVAHAGGVSFGAEKIYRVRQNRQALAARYPHYRHQYRHFLQSDPPAPARSALLQALRAHNDAGSEWLHFAQQKAKLEVLRGGAGLPALPASVARIAVWQYRPGSPFAQAVLQLARAIAGSGRALRLLIFGHADDSIWQTGVVDVLPFAAALEDGGFSNLELCSLLGCECLLTEQKLSIRLKQYVFCGESSLLDWWQAEQSTFARVRATGGRKLALVAGTDSRKQGPR